MQVLTNVDLLKNQIIKHLYDPGPSDWPAGAGPLFTVHKQASKLAACARPENY
jgi:hypothetical protein